MVINAAHDGTHAITLPLNGDAYPGTDPHISNFTSAQAINPAAAFKLIWDTFSGGTADSQSAIFPARFYRGRTAN